MKIIYFDIDTLRPDHLGCYGYGRNTSPNIDRIASEGVVFDNVYASDMPCMPSRTSLFSGRFGIHHGCVAHTGTRAEPFGEGPDRPFRSQWAQTSWMRHLRNAGMYTVTFSAFGERHAAWHWYAGFAEIHDTGQFGHDNADNVTPSVLEWLDRNRDSDDWFLHVNYWDAHTPYRAPQSYGSPFEDGPNPNNWITQELLEKHHDRPGIRSARDALFLRYADKLPRNPKSLDTLDDIKQMIDGYDTGIRYADEHVGQVLRKLEAMGILEDTAVIISADHGENFGELNSYGGHCFADEHTAHIPLIIRWPGVTDDRKGIHSTGLHYNIDLAATVNDLLEIEKHRFWDAESFADALRSGSPSGREHLVLSQLAQCCQRAVRFRSDDRELIYIRTYRSGHYIMDDELLFDLSSDPHECRNFAPQDAELLDHARGLLTDWQDRMLAEQKEGDPLAQVLAEREEYSFEQYAARLRETGREYMIPLIQDRSIGHDQNM